MRARQGYVFGVTRGGYRNLKNGDFIFEKSCNGNAPIIRLKSNVFCVSERRNNIAHMLGSCIFNSKGNIVNLLHAMAFQLWTISFAPTMECVKHHIVAPSLIKKGPSAACNAIVLRAAVQPSELFDLIENVAPAIKRLPSREVFVQHGTGARAHGGERLRIGR